MHTSRGNLVADTVFVTVNHDIDRLFPDYAEDGGLVRCRLHMMRATLPVTSPLPTPLFTGWSLLRYSGFAELPGTALLEERLRAEFPDYVALDLHQMYTPQPDGSILIGDTHFREHTASPFQSEAGFEALLRETRTIFGVDRVDVTERWQGLYRSAPGSEFLLATPKPTSPAPPKSPGRSHGFVNLTERNWGSTSFGHAEAYSVGGNPVQTTGTLVAVTSFQVANRVVISER